MIDPESLLIYTLPRFWMPVVFVHFSNESALPSIAKRLNDTTNLVLVTSDDKLPEIYGTEWNMCITTKVLGPDKLERIGQGYVGWWSVPDLSDLITLCDIQSKNRQLNAIELATYEMAAMVVAPNFLLSVVICTYQRSATLEKSIRSVLNQTLSPSKYEIVIVNNEPLESYPKIIVEKVLSEIASDSIPVIRIIDCPLTGLSYARNAGLSESIGEYIVFLDDDAIASEDALEWLSSAFIENQSAGIIGGHIRLNVPNPRPAVCPEGKEALWSQFITGHTEYSELTNWWEFPYGANWAARRIALFQVGGFRCNFGRIGDDFGGGEEIVAAILVKQLGYTIGIEPRSEVLHDVEAHRYTIKHVNKTIQAGLLANYKMQISLYIPSESNNQGITKTLIKDGSSYLLKGFTKSRASRIDRIYERAYLIARIWLLREKLYDIVKRHQKPLVCSKF
jgi:O-antigen biosynthesis protein